jgi:hypothetical protein
MTKLENKDQLEYIVYCPEKYITLNQSQSENAIFCHVYIEYLPKYFNPIFFHKCLCIIQNLDSMRIPDTDLPSGWPRRSRVHGAQLHKLQA